MTLIKTTQVHLKLKKSF